MKNTICIANGQEGGHSTSLQVTKEKQTILGLYATAAQAYEKWKINPEKILILDVRTPEEYIFVGHAKMAMNIPAAIQTYQWDSDKQDFS